MVKQRLSNVSIGLSIKLYTKNIYSNSTVRLLNIRSVKILLAHQEIYFLRLKAWQISSLVPLPPAFSEEEIFDNEPVFFYSTFVDPAELGLHYDDDDNDDNEDEDHPMNQVD